MNSGVLAMNYAGIGIIAFLIHVIINFDVLRLSDRVKGDKTHRSYRAFLVCVLVFYLFDLLWGFVYEARYNLLSFVWTELYFVSVAITVFFWTRFVVTYINKDNLFSRLLKYAGILFLAFEFLVLLLNIFFPVMFYFDANGEYHTEKARSLTMFAQILLFLATPLYMFFVAARTAGKIRHHHLTIGGFGIAMVIFVILATFFPVLPFYALGYLLGTCVIHTFVLEDEKEDRRKELERLLEVGAIQEREIGSARLMALTDPLTGIKSKFAYQEDLIGIDMRIADGILQDSGLIVFDINDLKVTNDTKGHEEGDRLIKEASSFVCQTFKHSPVYRIGGDEMVAFLMGDDFKNRVELLRDFNLQMEKNARSGSFVIACGFSQYMPGQDRQFCTIFGRADMNMYERKKQLKNLQV